LTGEKVNMQDGNSLSEMTEVTVELQLSKVNVLMKNWAWHKTRNIHISVRRD